MIFQSHSLSLKRKHVCHLFIIAELKANILCIIYEHLSLSSPTGVRLSLMQEILI